MTQVLLGAGPCQGGGHQGQLLKLRQVTLLRPRFILPGKEEKMGHSAHIKKLLKRNRALEVGRREKAFLRVGEGGQKLSIKERRPPITLFGNSTGYTFSALPFNPAGCHRP